MLRRLSSAAGGLARRISSPPPPHLDPSSVRTTIQAVPRERSDAKATARDLANGRIPTVLFSRPQARNRQYLTTSRDQILSILAGTPSLSTTKFTLEVRAGEGSSLLLSSSTVIPYKVHKDAQENITCLEVARADGKVVQVSVPIVYKGEDVCPGLKKGGRLQKIPALIYRGPKEHIPPMLEVDLTKLDIKDKVLINDIKVHPSLKPLNKGGGTVPVCKIWGPSPNPSLWQKLLWHKLPRKPKPVAEATEETPKLVLEA